MAFKLYQQTEVNWKLVAGLKIVVFVGIILVAGLGFAWQKKNAQINQAKVRTGFNSLINQADGVILTIPY
ncbi:hypothetical protein KKE48_00780, partial [Patescibacteria group bacterium]|nr:hypothetical protein [Patescibacteria group bacterium]